MDLRVRTEKGRERVTAYRVPWKCRLFGHVSSTCDPPRKQDLHMRVYCQRCQLKGTIMYCGFCGGEHFYGVAGEVADYCTNCKSGVEVVWDKS